MTLIEHMRVPRARLHLTISRCDVCETLSFPARRHCRACVAETATREIPLPRVGQVIAATQGDASQLACALVAVAPGIDLVLPLSMDFGPLPTPGAPISIELRRATPRNLHQPVYYVHKAAPAAGLEPSHRS